VLSLDQRLDPNGYGPRRPLPLPGGGRRNGELECLSKMVVPQVG
jgi:hypothetical protein